MDGSKKQMQQPLYNDEYGVLKLVSTRFSEGKSQSFVQYGPSENFAEPVSWLVKLKKWVLT